MKIANHMQLATVLLQFLPVHEKETFTALISDLMDNYLFANSFRYVLLKNRSKLDASLDVHLPTLPLCTSRLSRVNTMSFILELVTNNSMNHSTVIAAISRLHLQPICDYLKKSDGVDENFDAAPLTVPKRFQGCAGLKNAGATCYMNAVIQQLYMQPVLRNCLLRVKIPASENHENILFHTQNLFASMKYGLAQYYVPDGCWKSYRNASGELVNG